MNVIPSGSPVTPIIPASLTCFWMEKRSSTAKCVGLRLLVCFPSALLSRNLIETRTSFHALKTLVFSRHPAPELTALVRSFCGNHLVRVCRRWCHALRWEDVPCLYVVCRAPLPLFHSMTAQFAELCPLCGSCSDSCLPPVLVRMGFGGFFSCRCCHGCRWCPQPVKVTSCMTSSRTFCCHSCGRVRPPR
jgi:hypothetical protein